MMGFRHLLSPELLLDVYSIGRNLPFLPSCACGKSKLRAPRDTLSINTSSIPKPPPKHLHLVEIVLGAILTCYNPYIRDFFFPLLTSYNNVKVFENYLHRFHHAMKLCTCEPGFENVRTRWPALQGTKHTASVNWHAGRRKSTHACMHASTFARAVGGEKGSGEAGGERRGGRVGGGEGTKCGPGVNRAGPI